MIPLGGSGELWHAFPTRHTASVMPSREDIVNFREEAASILRYAIRVTLTTASRGSRALAEDTEQREEERAQGTVQTSQYAFARAKIRRHHGYLIAHYLQS
jgi:hypothetical protein